MKSDLDSSWMTEIDDEEGGTKEVSKCGTDHQEETTGGKDMDMKR